MSIFSNGLWCSMLTNSTTNSETFTHYLIKINDWINKNKLFGFSKVIILLDNWPYHKSKRTIDKFNNINLNMMFLPPYSSSFASIELIFGLIKQKLCKQLLLSFWMGFSCKFFTWKAHFLFTFGYFLYSIELGK